ncbi:hypothetical protein V9T40_013362 [Parthenolecanium corni]|uniref:Fatty acid desaturase domain-containing protein n=1 Tax=Parthenolecanium corni TaxID=536013 RepID=A0AAN9TLP5_9HEMI
MHKFLFVVLVGRDDADLVITTKVPAIIFLTVITHKCHHVPLREGNQFKPLVLIVLAGTGILCGAHRLWSHNSYKATWPLRLFLMLCQTLSTQFSVYSWVRDHRLHHKFSDTEIDPHNSNRGFFFSHIGWFMTGRAQEAKKELRKIWMEDIRRDKIVMFQYYLYIPMVFIFSFIGPSFIPWYFWNENLLLSHLAVTHLRNVVVMHLTFTVNSLAHTWGMKPFDRFMKPVDSTLVWFTTLGSEGWHNYHHVFPWDYKASEYWGYKRGLSTNFIELCARLGLAYDLKTTSPDFAMKRRLRTGDLSCHVWGWNDPGLDLVDKDMAVIRHKKDEDQPSVTHSMAKLGELKPVAKLKES